MQMIFATGQTSQTIKLPMEMHRVERMKWKLRWVNRSMNAANKSQLDVDRSKRDTAQKNF